MSLIALLHSESALALVGALAGTVWTAFRSADGLRRVRDRRYNAALSALEAGVEQTYREYVHAIKEARADGRLTGAERVLARERARRAAIAFGRTQGVDVLAQIGDEFIDLWISRLVREAKSTPRTK